MFSNGIDTTRYLIGIQKIQYLSDTNKTYAGLIKPIFMRDS